MWQLLARQIILSGSWLIKLLTTALSEPKFKFLKLLDKVMGLDSFVTSAQHEDLFMY